MGESIQREISGPAAYLTVDRMPDYSWTLQTVWDLGNHILDAGQDTAVRSVVIRAAGNAFCLGGEIGGPRDRSTSVAVHRRTYCDAYVRLWSIIETSPVPVIARVHGPVSAGGLAVVAACDVAVAATPARAATPEIRGGLFPLLAMGLLYPHLRPKEAFSLFYSGAWIDAIRAKELGLYTEVVEPPQLDDRIGYWVTRIGDADRRAVAIGRRTYWAMASTITDGRIEQGARALAELLSTVSGAPDQSYMQQALAEEDGPSTPA
jgi:enoyl-CoA hydratase